MARDNAGNKRRRSEVVEGWMNKGYVVLPRRYRGKFRLRWQIAVESFIPFDDLANLAEDHHCTFMAVMGDDGREIHAHVNAQQPLSPESQVALAEIIRAAVRHMREEKDDGTDLTSGAV